MGRRRELLFSSFKMLSKFGKAHCNLPVELLMAMVSGLDDTTQLQFIRVRCFLSTADHSQYEFDSV